MAIISVTEVEGSRTGGTVWSSSMARNYNRKFIVVVDNYSYGPGSVCDAPGLPLPFSLYTTGDGTDFDVLALMINMMADMAVAGDRLVWIVTCTYSTEMPEGGPSNCFFGNNLAGAQNNPEQEPWVIGWEPETITRARQWDLAGRPFLSSALKPFKPTPSYEAARPVLTFSRNQLTFTRSEIVDYSYAVNSDDFLGATPGTAQCMPPNAKLTYRGSLAYWRVTWKIRFGTPDPSYAAGIETFSPIYLLDQDTFHLQNIPGAPNLGKPVPIVKNGVAVVDPLLLDGAGQEDESGGVFPTFLPFDIYPSQPFNALFLAGLGEVTP